MKKVKYVGPYEAVDIPAVGVACEQGGTVEVADDVADSLLEQKANWEPVTAGKSAGKAAGDKE